MKMNHWVSLVAAIAFGTSCGKSKHIDGVACDTKAVGALAASLDKANGIGVDLTNAKVKADIEAATKEVIGKTFAFDGCKFQSQGNDVVSFSAADSDTTRIECVMKDGEAGVSEFRRAAMKIGQDKLRLDVTGVIASHGNKDFARYKMTKCEISTHE
jgi:hypothetical protein